MRILYLPCGAENAPDVEAALSALSCDVVRPDSLEEQDFDLVLSLRYDPEVSRLCLSRKVKYAVWISAPYEPSLYSCTLLNACNYIFLSDYALYEEFADGNPRVFFLPLAADTDRIGKILENSSIDSGADSRAGSGDEGGFAADLSMMQDVAPRESMGYHPLSPESPLKDAVKGYLEGCIACQHQLSGLPSMAEHLPPWVWQELIKEFPAVKRADSVETAAHYYDCRYFNGLITQADRDIHLNALAANQYFESVALYGAGEGYTAEEVRCFPHFDRLRQAPLIARESKINLVIAHRNLKSGIPQIAWDIMASGGFLLGSFQADYLRLLKGTTPVLYGDEMEMMSRAIYYLHHESERRELAEHLAETVRREHTYRQRLSRLLAVVEDT